MRINTTKKKKSIDFYADNLDKAELYVQQNGLKSVSQLINNLIETVLSLSPEVRQGLASYCVDMRQKLLDTDVSSDEVYRQAEIDMQLRELEGLERYFGDGSITPLQSKESFQVVKLQEGFGDAVFPKDWVVLNEDKASKAKYAFVFEGRNGNKYGVGHYVYFYTTPFLTDELEAEIYDLVKSHSYAATEAFNHQYKGTVLRECKFDHELVKKWEAAFEPAIFLLPIENAKNHELLYGSTGYPYGAHIRRPDGYNFSQDDILGI